MISSEELFKRWRGCQRDSLIYWMNESTLEMMMVMVTNDEQLFTKGLFSSYY